MDIVCPGCGQRYRIDDEKAPKEAYFKCQKCNETIRIASPATTSQPENTKTDDAQGDNEILPSNTMAALIYAHEPTMKNNIIAQLDRLGYTIREADDIRGLRERLKYNIYQVVIVAAEGTFQGKEEQDFFNKDINSLLPDARRQTLVIYILPDGNRLDLLAAFSFGVDLLIRPADIQGLDKIIQDAHASKKTTYRIFQECKTKAGGGLFLAS